ncbi:MAG: ROK family protein [Firmicutes bacterium]|nr:ROK family protein [Bacillota bacterium]
MGPLISGQPNQILIGAVEAGGTKFVCAVGTGPGGGILARKSYPTGDHPERLLNEIAEWFREQERVHGKIGAMGVASFGPVDLNPHSPTYGYITSTPKTSWMNTNLLGSIQQAFPGIPIGFDTDVNGAALGEHTWGNGAGLSDFVYITIGTGIGAGGMAGGQLIHGLIHPEMGHIFIPREPGDGFPGVCPYHGSCWEGLCSGPALGRRSGIAAEELPPDHPAWTLEIKYTAYAVANIVCILSPQRIIIGGSVRKAGKLGEGRFFTMIREQVRKILNGYIVSPVLDQGIDRYIVPPLLGDDAGICGAIALGQKKLFTEITSAQDQT